MDTEITNLLTVDVEDWQQSTLDPSLPISERALCNTRRMLDILSACGAQGTFFIQTLVAEKYPELVGEIARGGHEIATHGHGHIPLFKLTPDAFAADLQLSLKILKSLSPHPIRGYRAPDFSIRKDTLWAWEILKDQGLRYSSSIYPIRGRRYGFPGFKEQPHEVGKGLWEIPLSTIRLAGRNWPVAGGGYFRIFPLWFTRWAIRRLNREGRPAVVYLHPYELDAREIRQFRRRIPSLLYLTQSLNRSRTEAKIRTLLREFKFRPIQETISP